MYDSEVIICKFNGTLNELQSYEVPPLYNKFMHSQIITDEAV